MKITRIVLRIVILKIELKNSKTAFLRISMVLSPRKYKLQHVQALIQLDSYLSIYLSIYWKIDGKRQLNV